MKQIKINQKDFQLHSKSIEEIKDSIWKKLVELIFLIRSNQHHLIEIGTLPPFLLMSSIISLA